MTCVSLRSGIASSGTVFIDHTPATPAAETRRNTMKRFLAENSMMALIMAMNFRRRRLRLRHGHRRIHRLRGRRAAGLWLAHAARGGFELALGINQECAGRYDALAGRQPVRDRQAVAEPAADDHLPRLEITVPQVDEHGLPIAGIEHGVRRDDELLGAGHPELDVHEHVRLHAKAWIVRIEMDLERTRHGIDLRLDVADLGRE